MINIEEGILLRDEAEATAAKADESEAANDVAHGSQWAWENWAKRNCGGLLEEIAVLRTRLDESDYDFETLDMERDDILRKKRIGSKKTKQIMADLRDEVAELKRKLNSPRVWTQADEDAYQARPKDEWESLLTDSPDPTLDNL